MMLPRNVTWRMSPCHGAGVESESTPFQGMSRRFVSNRFVPWNSASGNALL
jgi:hypothetical protein